MVSKRLKSIITTAALGLGGLAGSAYAQAFPANSTEGKLMQKIRAEVARTGEYKWGYGIAVFEEPCTPQQGDDFLTACVGKPKEYTVCTRNEEWRGATDVANASSKAQCSTLRLKEDGTAEWFAMNSQHGTKSCQWGVDDRLDLEYIATFSKDDVNGGINNIRAGHPGAKPSDATSLDAMGLVLSTPTQCRDATPFERAIDQGWFATYSQADPWTIDLTRVVGFDQATGSIVYETKVYKIQPKNEGFDWRADYVGTKELKTRHGLQDGQAVPKYEKAILQWTDVNLEVAANWYAEAGIRVGRNADGTWITQKIDNKGWSQQLIAKGVDPTSISWSRERNELSYTRADGNNVTVRIDPNTRAITRLAGSAIADSTLELQVENGMESVYNPIEVDFQVAEEFNDGPCGRPDNQFNDWGLCPTGAPFTACLQNGVVSYQEKFDARVNPGNVAHGLARVQQLSDESALLWYFTPSNNETNMKVIDGSSVNDHYWGYASSLTNVLEERIFSNELTGAQKIVPGNLGQIAQPYHDVELFPKNP